MPKYQLDIPHTLALDEAKKRIDEATGKLSTDYGATCTWKSDNELAVSRKGLDARSLEEAWRRPPQEDRAAGRGGAPAAARFLDPRATPPGGRDAAEGPRPGGGTAAGGAFLGEGPGGTTPPPPPPPPAVSSAAPSTA